MFQNEGNKENYRKVFRYGIFEIQKKIEGVWQIFFKAGQQLSTGRAIGWSPRWCWRRFSTPGAKEYPSPYTGGGTAAPEPESRPYTLTPCIAEKMDAK